MAERGTLEIVGQVLGELLAPLAEHLQDGEHATRLFNQLGLNLPPELLMRPGFTAKIAAGAAAAEQLPPKVATLVDAIADGEIGPIVTASRELLAEVSRVVTAVEALADALQDAAGAVGGISTAELRTFAGELPERLINFLAVEWLERKHPNAAAVLLFTGLVEEVAERADVDDPRRPTVVRRTLRPDRVPDLLTDPFATVAELYRWGRPDLDADRLLDALRRLLAAVGRLVYLEVDGAGGLPEVRARDVTLRPRLDGGIPGLDIVLAFAIADALDLTTPIAPGLDVRVGVSAAIAASTTITVRPPLEIAADPPAVPLSGHLEVELVKRSTTPGQPMTLLGLAGGPRIEAGALRAGGEVDLAWDVPRGVGAGEVTFELALDEGKVIITLAGADGFLAAILPGDGLALEVDLGLGWSSERGVFFRGSAALEVDVPVDQALGPIKLSALHLGLAPRDAGLRLEASTAVGARLGPFAMAVDRLGFLADLTFPAEGGNLHFADLALGFKPPSGIGLSLNASVVKGGGYLFLDPDKGEYAGVLELAFGPVSIKAIGILTTKLPGQSGWALLLLVFSEFPAVQLSFGFTLNGVGGIIGLQHGISVEALQNGLRTGVLDAVLFPRDPVANATQIINQLRTVFPVTPRALTIGPVVQLGWGTPSLIKISLGIILQLDNVLGSGTGEIQFSRIVLVGQLEVHVPPLEDLGDDVPELIRLKVDVLGAWETRERRLSIDARLRDSHVALLPLTGSLVVRANFGDRPSFILAVGGFHPRFTDLPPGIPPQDRVGIELRFGILVVRIAGYVAITSNSFQVGAEASIVASAAGFRAEAYLGFDALFIFEPVFHFEIDFRIGASIRYKGISLASADLRGSVSGPGRWQVSGKAEISLLFFSVTVGFNEAWGSAPEAELPSIRVGERLAAAFGDRASWTAQLPAGAETLVSLRGGQSDDEVVAHPLGALAAVQKVVPLQLDITRVGSARPADGTRFDVTGVDIGARSTTPTFSREHFARAQYLDLTEEQKLSTPSFEQFPAGIAVSTTGFAAPAPDLAFDPRIETVYLGESRGIRSVGRLPIELLVSQARRGAAAKSELRAMDALVGDGSLRVRVEPTRYAVADTTALHEAVPLGADALASFTLASQTALAHQGPAQVVEAIELVAAT